MALFETFSWNGAREGPHLLITAGIHGDEHEGVAALRELAVSGEVRLVAGRLTIVPVANASAHTANRRTGSDGLDLARTFPGDPAGTVTEQVAAELTHLIRRADLFIDLHSGGRAMYVEPLVGYMLVSDKRVLERQRQMARAFGLPTIWGTSPLLQGRSLSTARDAGVPAIYAEYQGGGALSDDGVAAYVSGCLSVMSWAGMSDNGSTMPEPLRIIEDDRPGSGHLQIQHPSPIPGTWRLRAELGMELEKGDLLGHVDGLRSGSLRRILADVPGRVIGLRACPKVKKGDSLAVILENTSK